MQISQHVRVRRAHWRIAGIQPYEDCRLVTLTALGHTPADLERRILTPFDFVEPLDRPTRPRVVGARLWRQFCRARLSAHTPPGSLRSPVRARIDLLPHQLEPALAVLRGMGSRLLLADEVGLGKTIQAGLVLAELFARGIIERVLILTPAGLRDQWTRELSGRFGIEASIADARALRSTAAALPIGVNPWSTVRVAIASMDYIKRPEVLPAACACRWDVVVVDEAHGAVGDSDRRQAVRSLAERAPYVLLVTATPHSGDRDAFAALCGLGAIRDDALLVFRRTRAAVDRGTVRRVRTMNVCTNVAEHSMHAELARYTRAARAELGDRCLALSVLHKRAFSSPWALARSVDRRLAALCASPCSAAAEEAQLVLPLGDSEGDLTAEDQPPAWPADIALADAARERALLTSVAAAARDAAEGGGSKLRALGRLLRRARESAIVFTEYRDTLQRVREALHRQSFVLFLLHGGLTRVEREAAIEGFIRCPGSILLATDAAGEGLNLQRTCRLVVSLELPWNPMRLEQRIGRVDRIGQARAVHAIHFVAAGTGEARILTRLRARLDRARADVAAPNPLGSDAAFDDAGADDERASARLVVGDVSEQSDAPSIPTRSVNTHLMPELSPDALREVERIAEARALDDEPGARLANRLEGDVPLVVRARRFGLRKALGRRALFIWRVDCENGCGGAVESTIIPAAIELRREWPREHNALGRALEQTARDLRSTIDAHARPWRRAAHAISRSFWTTRLSREHAIAALDTIAGEPLFQPGLFDRRAERLRRYSADSRDASTHDNEARLAALAHMAGVADRAPELFLVLLP
jgi:superfamily II DNA or RNA helicase